MNTIKKSWGRVQSAMQVAVGGWLYDPNVMFIDYGWRERGGQLIENEQCIRIHVLDKIDPGPRLEAAAESGKTRGPIPDSINGIPVDVPQGEYALHQRWWGGWWSRATTRTAVPRARRSDPMKGGISISNGRLSGYGTLGGQVTDRETGKKMLLSNWHVLAGVWHARPGWPIYQPGRGDGGTGADTVATLSRHAMDSNLDAAVAELTGSRQLTDNQFGLEEPVTGVGWAQLGMDVIKSGRKTNVTYGLVTGIEGTIKMSYDGVRRLVRKVMTIEPRPGQNEVSAGGDSGSFWLHEETMRAVGLHFAGSDYPERALAIDIQPVLDRLGVTLP